MNSVIFGLPSSFQVIFDGVDLVAQCLIVQKIIRIIIIIIMYMFAQINLVSTECAVIIRVKGRVL